MGGRSYDLVELIVLVNNPYHFYGDRGNRISVSGFVDPQHDGVFLFPCNTDGSPVLDSPGILLQELQETPEPGLYEIRGKFEQIAEPHWVRDQTKTSFGDTVQTPNIEATVNRLFNYCLVVDSISEPKN